MAQLWELLKDHPTILADKESQLSLELFRQLQKNRTDNAKEGKSGSYLIIVDRSLDLRTPLVHDLTFQPLIYDLFSGKKELSGDYFSHTQVETDSNIHICLTSEDEPQWQEVKYLPLPEALKHFQEEITHSMDKGLRKSFAGNFHLLGDKKGFEAYDEIIQPIQSDLENYLTALNR